MIVLHHARGVGWKTIKKIYDLDPTLSAIFKMDAETIRQTFHIKPHFATLIHHDLHKLNYMQISKQYEQRKIHIVTIFDHNYPQLLKEIYDPPWVLYCKGNLEFLNYPKMISVVGTRDPTNYGIQCMNKILPVLISEGWLIVSGLAYGIDFNAHKLALEQGRTIAVLGSGLEYVYPSEHKDIANQIATKHLLVSEYPPMQKAQKWQFPFRNRIISGLTRGTIVIEAKEKSGSFITADQALQQGRDVFAIPGSIFSLQSVGTNALIQLGAKLVRTGEDIIQELTFYT